jgi:hypothetical protein
LTPLTTRPPATSRQGITRFLTIAAGSRERARPRRRSARGGTGRRRASRPRRRRRPALVIRRRAHHVRRPAGRRSCARSRRRAVEPVDERGRPRRGERVPAHVRHRLARSAPHGPVESPSPCRPPRSRRRGAAARRRSRRPGARPRPLAERVVEAVPASPRAALSTCPTPAISASGASDT